MRWCILSWFDIRHLQLFVKDSSMALMQSYCFATYLQATLENVDLCKAWIHKKWSYNCIKGGKTKFGACFMIYVALR